jgi:hypothetical protein
MSDLRGLESQAACRGFYKRRRGPEAVKERNGVRAVHAGAGVGAGVNSL